MPGEYASKTDVPTSRSLDEIKRTLIRFGADAETFAYAEQGRRVGIQFAVGRKQVRMMMVLPDRASFERDSRGKLRVATAVNRDHDQACRQRWRTLAAGIKAKLAMIDDGISTFEREFLADIILPSGETVGERIAPSLDEAVESGVIPELVPGLPQTARVIAISERAG